MNTNIVKWLSIGGAVLSVVGSVLTNVADENILKGKIKDEVAKQLSNMQQSN